MPLGDSEIYKIVMKIGEYIRDQEKTWKYFGSKSQDVQVIWVADSLDANIAEGFRCFSSKENKLFWSYIEGLGLQTLTWTKKRNIKILVLNDIFKQLLLHRKLNAYIISIGNKNDDN